MFAARAFIVMMKTKLARLIIPPLRLGAFAQVEPKRTRVEPVYEKGGWGYAGRGGAGSSSCGSATPAISPKGMRGVVKPGAREENPARPAR